MLAVAGGKGGCGKTTTTYALAGAVAGEARAIDADVGTSNLHALAGVNREIDGEDTARTDPPAPRVTDDGVEVVPAPAAGELSHATLAGLDRDVPTFVDCPAGAGPDAATPLAVAEGVVLVTTPCVAALRGAAKTAGMARALESPVVGVVVTRARTAPARIADLLGCPVLGTVPRADSPLESPAVERAYRRIRVRLFEAAEPAMFGGLGTERNV